MPEKIRARIGMISFINTAPLYETWKKTVVRQDWRIVEAVPSELNRMLFRDELDLGIVSSFEYAAHPARYKILSDLSITASGPVGSVFLFSKQPPADLGGRLVLLSSQSQTSVCLVKIVLEEFYKVRPSYASGDVCSAAAGPEEIGAVMAIGDDALRLAADKGAYPFRLDLGEAWHRRTGLPFVFAVWAVREEFCEKEPEILREIHRELLRCTTEGRKDLASISRRVAPRIPMSPEDCYAYLRAMEYDLGPEKLEALKRFFWYLVKRGEGDPGALPLKIIGQA